MNQMKKVLCAALCSMSVMGVSTGGIFAEEAESVMEEAVNDAAEKEDVKDEVPAEVTDPADDGSVTKDPVNPWDLEDPMDIFADTIAKVYRLYNPNSGEHFYTENKVEYDYLGEIGWKQEGTAWYAPKAENLEDSDETFLPVYRVYNPNAGDHHYTLDENEKDYLITHGWNDEGIAMYSNDKKGDIIYRLYNPNAETGTHHFTKDLNEAANLVEAGWIDEGEAIYAEPDVFADQR